MEKREFYIAGVKFHELPLIINEVEIGEVLTLEPEPSNQYDPNAVKILRGDVMTGYVPKKFSSEVAMMIENDFPIQCRVIEVNVSAKPWEACKVVIEEVDAEEDSYE